jgi:ATP-dependent RNA helicase DDX54/DBP10
MVDHVINYDFPANSRVFVHRTGRTARGGRPGTAWSLVEKSDLPYFCDLNAFLRTADQETVLHAMSRQQVADMSEHIASSLDHTSGLTDLRAVMLRGEAMYRRSRSKASAAGYKAARTLPTDLAEFDAREEPLSSVESQRQDLLTSLSSFRPATPAVTATAAAVRRTANGPRQRPVQVVEPVATSFARGTGENGDHTSSREVSTPLLYG